MLRVQEELLRKGTAWPPFDYDWLITITFFHFSAEELWLWVSQAGFTPERTTAIEEPKQEKRRQMEEYMSESLAFIYLGFHCLALCDWLLQSPRRWFNACPVCDDAPSVRVCARQWMRRSPCPGRQPGGGDPLSQFTGSSTIHEARSGEKNAISKKRYPHRYLTHRGYKKLQQNRMHFPASRLRQIKGAFGFQISNLLMNCKIKN